MKLSVGGGKEGVEEDGGVDVEVRRGGGATVFPVKWGVWPTTMFLNQMFCKREFTALIGAFFQFSIIIFQKYSK